MTMNGTDVSDESWRSDVIDANTRQRTETGLNGDPAPDSGDRPTDEAATGVGDIATVTAERDDYLDQLRRSMAEFANFRRRTEQERAQIREIANQALLAQFLPVYDDLQRALSAVPEGRVDDSLVQGLRLVERKFWGSLERAGISTIDAQGQPFDPAIHEAVDSVAGSSADTVVEVYQPGYRLGQGLLRPAMVKVGGKSDEAAAG